LWHDFKSHGDDAAREALILHYMPLVTMAVDKWRGRPYGATGYDDLKSAATIGLIMAVDRYDFSKGARFETFAYNWIRGQMYDAVRRSNWIPRRVVKNRRRIAEAHASLEARLSRPATESEVAAHLGLTVDNLECMEIECARGQIVPWTVQLEHHEAQTDDRAEDERRADRLQLCRWIQRAIAVLPERELKIIYLYYWKGLRFKEIAPLLGICPSQVSRLHARAMKMISEDEQTDSCQSPK